MNFQMCQLLHHLNEIGYKPICAASISQKWVLRDDEGKVPYPQDVNSVFFAKCPGDKDNIAETEVVQV